jgi:ribosomal protein L37AE/L43A
MGGNGSGRRSKRQIPRTLIEKCLSIDVNLLARRRLLVPGEWRWIRWPQAKKWAVVLRGESTSDPMIFVREFRHSEPPDYCKEFGISLASTQQRLGGVRWWFVCSECNRRMVKLYRPQGASNWACRDCHELTYGAAQGATDFERIRRQTLQALERKLRKR